MSLPEDHWPEEAQYQSTSLEQPNGEVERRTDVGIFPIEVRRHPAVGIISAQAGRHGSAAPRYMTPHRTAL
jgi:hypothetical protein